LPTRFFIDTGEDGRCSRVAMDSDSTPDQFAQGLAEFSFTKVEGDLGFSGRFDCLLGSQDG